jgi:eukaryotic-like serine/threonine-protein kinase
MFSRIVFVNNHSVATNASERVVSREAGGLRLKVCDVCGGRYKDKGNPRLCPFDGTPLRDLPDPMLGRTIAGHYVITQKLGAGGFGTVFRARHEVLGRDVAIKFLNPDLAIDATNRSRFLREAKAANRIDHEHIIDITDYGETDDGMVYLVMELLEGKPLSAELAKGPLSITRVIDISSQVAAALARAHELDVIHRDIKPDNIYLVEVGARRDFVKLLDFGLAHMKGELRLTATGAVFGTPEYMAPEQARGAPLTALADLYSVGCVLFHMLTGVLPFTGNTPDLILKHMREPAPLPSQKARGIPADLDLLVRKLMEKDPKKRHRDAYHLLEDLRKIGESLPSVRASVPARGEPSGARRRDAIMSIPPTATGAQLPSTLERRVQFFRELAERAHGASPPPWLLQAIEELARRVTDARTLERDLTQTGASTSGRETEIRNMRLRLGRAIDELGRDESRAAGEIDELYRKLAEARVQHAGAEAPLARALAAIRTGGSTVTRDVAMALRDAGAVAGSWLEAESQIESLGQQLRVRERERDDLRFQVSQMKGRLGGMNAEQDVELGAMRAHNTDLDRRHGALSDEIAQRAASITQHFANFPELRELVQAEARPAR